MFGEAGSSCATFTGRPRDSTWHVRCQHVISSSSQGMANFSALLGLVGKISRRCNTLGMHTEIEF